MTEEASNPCDGCPLQGERPIRGSGPKFMVDVMFIGEAPDDADNTTRRAFSGEAGQILRVAAERYLAGKTIYYTHSILCQPPNGRKPRKAEISACSGRLFEEIDKISPKVVVPLGNTALKALCGLDKITKRSGRELKLEDAKFKVFPIISPSSTLHVPRMRPRFLTDVRLLGEFLTGRSTAPEVKYELLTDDDDVESMCEVACMGSDPIAIDYETTSLKPWHGDPVTASICWQEGRSYMFHLDTDRKKTAWRELLKSGAPKIAHNAKFEYLWTRWHFGIKIRNLKACTMLMHYLLDEESPHDLQFLKKLYTPLGYWEDKMGEHLVNGGMHHDADPELLLNYACEDTDGCLRLYNVLLESMDKDLVRIHNEDVLPLAKTLADIELNGLRYDKEKSIEIGGKLAVDVQRQYDLIREDPRIKQLEEDVGKDFNPKSNPQKQKLFTDIMNLPCVHKTKSGNPSYGKESLQHYERMLPEKDWQLVKAVSDYNRMSSVHGRFTKEYPEAEVDGYLRTDYRPLTVTGRLMSGNPPLQNIATMHAFDTEYSVKECFPSRYEDGSMVNVDFKQMELVVLACLSGDDSMLGSFRRQEDLHVATAAAAYGIPAEDVDSDLRDKGKRINFASSFDVTAWTLARKFNISEDDAQELIHNLKQERFMVFAWSSSTKRELEANGYVKTPFGRPRRLPDARIRTNRKVQSRAFRQGVNFLIQSTASDTVMFSLMRLHKEFSKLKGKKPLIVATVHDSIVIDTPPEHLKKVLALTKQVCCMLTYKTFDWLKIPLRVDIEVGPTWAGAKEVEDVG